MGDYFDLIAGTSTGGIIALALSGGMPAKTILDIYTTLGPRVFPFPKDRVLNIWRFVRSTKHYVYDPAPLKQELTRILGTAMVGDAQRRLCIPSFDGFTEVYIFKTPHHPDYKLDWRESMVTVAMATAAAPTYFPIYRDRAPKVPDAPVSAFGTPPRYFADGGVWANNPIMIALVDALACYRIECRQVHILSLGTGDTEMRITEQQRRLGGLWHWRKIIDSAMHLQSQNVIGQAGLLIGRDQLIRLNAPPMADNSIGLDDYNRASAELPPIATQLVTKFGEAVRDRFLFNAADAYTAFHGPRVRRTS